MANVVSIERLNERDRVERLDNGASILVQQEGQNYFDRDTGKWEQSDSNIYPDDLVPGFTHNAKAGSGRVRLAKGGRFRVGLRHPLYVTYTPRGANVIAPMVAGNKAQYKGLWSKTDVDLVKFPEGVKETLILADASAPSSYVWDLEEIAGVVPTLSADGGLDYVETLTGSIVGRIPAPTVHDAAGVEGAATLTYSAGAVTIAVDPAWLADPARVWPVTLDPTTLVLQPDPTAGKDTYVFQGAATTNYGTTTYVGAGDGGAASTALRSLLQPDISAIPAGDGIDSAQLELYNNATGGADTFYNATLYRVTAAWDEATVTWDLQPAFDATAISTVASIANTAGWVAWTGLKTLILNWRSGIANEGVVLKKPSDGTLANDKKYFWSSDYTTDTTLRPKWTIVYTAAPTPSLTNPTGTQASPSQITNDVTPTLTGTYSSADSVAQSKYRFRIFDELNNLVVDQGLQTGTTNSWTVPAGYLKYGQKYKVEFYVEDANGGYATTTAWMQSVMSAPTGVTATADAANARISLAWTAHTGENLAGYNLYRKMQGAADTDYKKINLSLLTGTSATDDTAASAQPYTYALTAVATDGYESVKSAGADGTVTYAGAWIGGMQVDLRDLPRFSQERRASERLSLDGTWQIQDQGFAPPKVQLAVRYASAQERDAIKAIFPADMPVTYRDEQGNVLRGQITSSVDDERIYTAKSFHGVLRFSLTEVSA